MSAATNGAAHPLHVLVAGGGIGGLVTALALHARGVRVSVFEQAPSLGEIGAGIQLSANGTRLLIGLGLGEALADLACEPTGKEVRLYNTGQTWKLFDLGSASVARFGAPYWLLHRADLLRVLAGAAQDRLGGDIHLGARATGFTQDADSVTLQLADGRSVTGDVLIGGDGVHSAIRQTIFGAQPAQFLGIAAWRGVVPIERLPEHLRRPVGTNWVGPGGHIVTYPLRRGELFNFVGAIERENWPVESWTEAGTHEECLADFVGWHEDIQTIVRAIEVPYKWALLGRAPLPYYATGRVALMGDAAHPTLPFLAQGANMSIEDGVIIARCLTEGGDDVAAGLLRYQAARLERTIRIVQGATDNAHRFHNPALADPVQAQAYVDREWQPERIAARYDWLFEYDATTLKL